MIKKIYFSKIDKISLRKFLSTDKKKILKSILRGNIIIVKNVVNKKKILKICENIHKKKISSSSSKKMLEGVKNIFYLAKPIKKEKSINKSKYIVSNRSWYFFPWNRDYSGLVRLVQPVFNKVIEINGYNPKKIIKNTPKDGTIQRFHLMNYPIGNGYISKHVDSTDLVKVTAGIYLTEYKKNYKSGGFYVINSKKKKVNIDKHVNTSDMVLFYPSMPHGVDKITKPLIKLKKKHQEGRWFLNMTLVASHHVKNRITSYGV